MKYRAEMSSGGSTEHGKWGTLPQALKDMQLIADSAKLVGECNDLLDQGRHAIKELGGNIDYIQRKSETWTARVVDENHKVYKSKSWTVRVIV